MFHMGKVEELALACDICQSKSLSHYDLLYQMRDCEIIQCKLCGLVFVNALFDETIHAYGEVYASEIYEQVGPALLKRFAADLATIEKFVSVGKILDLGCGYGYFLSLAQKRGWDAEGVEINRNLVAYLNQEKGLRVFPGPLQDLHLQEESFDVITMFNIIEHFLHPSTVLAEVTRLLKDDGLLVLETPTEDGLFKKLADFLYKVTGGKFILMIQGAYQKGGHHFGFSRKSIKRILEKHGFEIISVDGRVSPFKEFLGKELLHTPLYLKGVKLFVVPILWALSRVLRLENRMIVYARKKKRRF